MKIKDLLEKNIMKAKVEVLTKSKFCRETKISRPTLDRLMKGEEPNLNTLKKICKYFGEDPKDYIDID